MTGEEQLYSNALRIDLRLDEVQAEQAFLFAAPASPRRSELLADAYRREAELWSELFTHAKVRAYWRAALRAEVEARRAQRYWTRRAAAEIAVWPVAVPMVTRTVAERIRAELTDGAA